MIRSTAPTAIQDRPLTVADLRALDAELDARGFGPAIPGQTASSARRRTHPWGGVEVWTWTYGTGRDARLTAGVMYEPGALMWSVDEAEHFTSIDGMRELLDDAGVFPGGGAR